MAQKINLVQGDTLPAIDVFLTDENTGDYIGLTGATVRRYFRALGDPEILATVDGILLPGIIDANGDVNEAEPYVPMVSRVTGPLLCSVLRAATAAWLGYRWRKPSACWNVLTWLTGWINSRPLRETRL